MQADGGLAEWVLDGRVTWELSPLQEWVDRSKAQVGFELRLFARHPDSASGGPACPECLRLYERLRAIALSVLPREPRPTRYEIEPFDGSLHLRPQSHWTPEVQLTLRLEHREGYFRPIDECERRCAEEIQTGLKALGAQPRTWSETRRD